MQTQENNEELIINDLNETPELINFEESTVFEEETFEEKNEDKQEEEKTSNENSFKNNPIADILANLNVVVLPFLTEKILNFFNREAKISINYDIKNELKENYSILLESEFINSLTPKERAVLSIILINSSFIATSFIFSSKKNEENTNNDFNKNIQNENIFNEKQQSHSFNNENIFVEEEKPKKKRGRPRKNQVIVI